MTAALTVLGMDPSLRNWGLARGRYLLDQGSLELDRLQLIQPIQITAKQVRQNSRDLHVAAQLYQEAWHYAQHAQAVFVEVPVGSQNARSMASYGVCMGVLGALHARGIPFFEVTPTEVKVAATGCKTATKSEMIEWALSRHPHADWPTVSRQGTREVSAAKAEHLADAIAAIYAGIRSKPFQQMMALLPTHSMTREVTHANPAQAI